MNIRPNILVIDDDLQTLETMKIYLNDFARVATVIGGRQAIDYIREHHVDLILLDVEMPIMDGFLTLEQLRNMEEFINVPVILVTKRNDKATILNSCIVGVDGYLVKPVEKNDLIDKIKEVLVRKNTKISKKTILMIDDDMAYLKQVYSMLHNEYNVIMINSTKLALNYILKNTPDLILLDYQMPLYNGANLLHMIQKNYGAKKIPTIILSGALNMDALQECYEYSPFAYLAKPVSKDVLIDNIERALTQ